MAIKQGTADGQRYLGATLINRVYLGSTRVYGDAPAGGGAFDATAFTADSGAVSGDVATAYVELNVDGSASLFGDVTSPSSPRWWSATPPDTWIEYTSTGDGSVDGGLVSGTRYQMNSKRTLGIIRGTVGGNSRTFTISFYDAASGGNLVGTKTFTASVEVF